MVGSKQPYVKLTSPFYNSCLAGDPQTANKTTSHLESAFNDGPQLLAHSIAGVLNLEIPSLRNYLLGREWPLSVSPSRILPPVLHGVDISLVELVLLIYGRHRNGRHEWLLFCQNCCV